MRLSPCMGICVHHLWPISAVGTSSGLDTWFILLFLDSKKLAEWLKMQGKICNLPTQFFSDPLCTQHRLPCSLASASIRVGVTHIPVMMHNVALQHWTILCLLISLFSCSNILLVHAEINCWRKWGFPRTAMMSSVHTRKKTLISLAFSVCAYLV